MGPDVKISGVPPDTPAAGGIDYELLWSLVGLAAGALVIATWATVGLPRVPCVFRSLTGLPCLTCGATRAMAALLAGDPATAFRLHPPTVATAVFYPVFALYVVGARWSAWPRLRVRLDGAERWWLRWIVCGLLGVTWLFLIADGR